MDFLGGAEKKKLNRNISLKPKTKPDPITPKTTTPKVVDDFDEFLNGKLDDEVDKQMETYLDEASKKTQLEVEKKSIEPQPVTVPKIVTKEIDPVQIKDENIIISESSESVVIQFKQIDPSADFVLEKLQFEKFQGLIHGIDCEDVIEDRIHIISANLMKKFGKILEIRHEEVRNKSDVYSEEEIAQLNYLRPSLQGNLYTLDEMIRILGTTLEKSIRRTAQHRKEKKQLRELYTVKEEDLNDCKEKISKLETKTRDLEAQLSHQKDKYMRERDALIAKLSQYETVDMKSIEEQATPMSESISKMFSRTNESLTSTFSSLTSGMPWTKPSEEVKDVKDAPKEQEKGLFSSWFAK
jgi:hypothetical protein